MNGSMKIREAVRTGLELKIARLRVGLKQCVLAAMIGISPVQLSEIEVGRRKISPDLLEYVIAAIGQGKSIDQG